MDFEIRTFVAAGSICFGMTKQAVRRLLPSPVVSFKRTPEVSVPSDHFTDLAVIVNYKKPGVVDSIEFATGSNPVFRGVALFNESVESARLFLQSLDPTLEVDCDGFTSHALGVGVYALMPELEEGEPGEMVSVIAFERGYYSTRI